MGKRFEAVALGGVIMKFTHNCRIKGECTLQWVVFACRLISRSQLSS